jgi:hypothetical protein
MSSPSPVPPPKHIRKHLDFYHRHIDRYIANIAARKEELQEDRRALARMLAGPTKVPGRFLQDGKRIVRRVPQTHPLYEPIRQGLIQFLEAEIAKAPTDIAHIEERIVRYQGVIVRIQERHGIPH